MPFADPTSVYLENLARRRAQAEMYGQQFRDASEGISKGLGQWDSAMRLQKADAAKAEAAKAEAEQQAFKNDIETRGLRIREAQEQREADEAARIAAARPGEEARAAEDRAFTLRKRETDTAQAARKAAIERIQSLPAELEFGEGVNVEAIIEQIGAEGGLSSDEALAAYRQAQTTRADAEDKAKLDAELKRAQIDKAKRVPMPKAPTVAARSDALKKSNAAGELLASASVVENIVNSPKFKDYTGPIDGLGTYLTSRLKMSDEDAAEIVATLGMYFDAYRVAVTGAAASDREMTMLAANVPGVQDSFSTVRGKLNAARKLASARQQYWEAAARGDTSTVTAPSPQPDGSSVSIPDDGNWK